MNEYVKSVRQRRTFAIISHPDAGKTTLTENLLQSGGAIQLAGTELASKSGRYATTDWMKNRTWSGFCMIQLTKSGKTEFSETRLKLKKFDWGRRGFQEKRL